MDKPGTYTFVWQQPPKADNPLFLWIQTATRDAKDMQEAWNSLYRELGKHDWFAQVGQSVLVIFGGAHTKQYYRVVEAPLPRILVLDGGQG